MYVARTMAAVVACAAVAIPARAQRAHIGSAPPESVVIVPAAEFAAGSFYRFWFGDTYRDLWTTPVRVPILDLAHFAGGISPTGEDTVFTGVMHFVNADGRRYVFRRAAQRPPTRDLGRIVDEVFHDEVSATLPFGTAMASPLLAAAGVMHPTPVAFAMPDDSLLGAYREKFAGRLGTIEEDPGVPKLGPGFGGAVEIIGTQQLVQLIDEDPREQIDARALLTARLMDMFMADTDRNPAMWRWARMSAKSKWIPIPVDRSRAFMSFDGAAIWFAHFRAPRLLSFRGDVPQVPHAGAGSAEFDRRLLSSLDRAAWDSAARALVRKLPDSVIDAAVRALPPEFAPFRARFTAILRVRRDLLEAGARNYYANLAFMPDVHGTDKDDRLFVNRVDNQSVDIRIESSDHAAYYRRRFALRDTPEIRVYLHGGSDTAVVTGHVNTSIRVRIVGGAGQNALIDSSFVKSEYHATELYDQGEGATVNYGPDTSFRRVPWIGAHRMSIPSARDRGAVLVPSVAFKNDRYHGLLSRVSLNRYAYSFGRHPWASHVGLDAEYASALNGVRLALTGDQRFKRSEWYATGRVRYSSIEQLYYPVAGSDTLDTETSLVPVMQKQLTINPGVGYSFGPLSTVTLGPMYTVSRGDVGVSPVVDRYGLGHFEQLGFRLRLRHDARDQIFMPHRRFELDLTAIATPAMLDVRAPYEELSAAAGVYLILPVPGRPMIAVRTGGKKLFGDYPFLQSAFIGGSTVRSYASQLFAGDAAVFGTAELRKRVARFDLLVPMELGVVGLLDADRVFLQSASPGGWHTAGGVGIWASLVHSPTVFNLALVNGRLRAGTLISTGLSFDDRPHEQPTAPRNNAVNKR